VPAGLRSLGILGGTFNPPHLGHLAVAQSARDELGLGRVLMMPARIPPHKPSDADPGPEHRLQMCRLLAAGEAGLSVSELEIDRDGPSYTVDSLRAIHASHPDAQLTFIVGADTASTMPRWREPEEVLELADLAVAERAGPGRAGVLEALSPLLGGHPPIDGEGHPEGISFLNMPAVSISSSMARERVARGEPVEDLVGAAVARYIAEHGLYRESAGAPG
jgi:nicotinate-nucleotide adenylyltransferase